MSSLAVVAFHLALLITGPTRAQDAEIVLADDEVALIGYGSLMNKVDMERTLGKPYDGAMREVKLQGWRRSWNVAAPNPGKYYTDTPSGRFFPKRIIYLNIRPDPASDLNAVLFVIKKSEFKDFIIRESVYNPVDVSKNLIGATVKGGSAYAFVGRAKDLVKPGKRSPDLAIRSTYVNIVRNSVQARGEDFAREFERTTDPLPLEPFKDTIAPVQAQKRDEEPKRVSERKKGMLQVTDTPMQPCANIARKIIGGLGRP